MTSMRLSALRQCIITVAKTQYGKKTIRYVLDYKLQNKSIQNKTTTKKKNKQTNKQKNMLTEVDIHI